MKKSAICIATIELWITPFAQAAGRTTRSAASGGNAFFIFCAICVGVILLVIVSSAVSAVNDSMRESHAQDQRASREAEREREQAIREANMSAQRRFIAQQRRLMSDSLRYDVMHRDGFRCQICGATQKDGVKLHVDHIFPVSKGGKTEMSNLRTLCERCNMGKRDKIETVPDLFMEELSPDEFAERYAPKGRSIGFYDDYGREILDLSRPTRRQ